MNPTQNIIIPKQTIDQLFNNLAIQEQKNTEQERDILKLKKDISNNEKKIEEIKLINKDQKDHMHLKDDIIEKQQARIRDLTDQKRISDEKVDVYRHHIEQQLAASKKIFKTIGGIVFGILGLVGIPSGASPLLITAATAAGATGGALVAVPVHKFAHRDVYAELSKSNHSNN